MARKMRITMACISSLILFGACNRSMASEAQHEADKLLDKVLKKCDSGDFYYVDEQVSGGRTYITDIKGASSRLEADPITDADRLNGIKWQGRLFLTARAYRRLEGPNSGKWSEWEDYRGEAFGSWYISNLNGTWLYAPEGDPPIGGFRRVYRNPSPIETASFPSLHCELLTSNPSTGTAPPAQGAVAPLAHDASYTELVGSSVVQVDSDFSTALEPRDKKGGHFKPGEKVCVVGSGREFAKIMAVHADGSRAYVYASPTALMPDTERQGDGDACKKAFRR